MVDVASLERTCGRLRRAVDAAQKDLEEQLGATSGDARVYAMRDQHGRYLLVDGLAALAQAEAAIVNARSAAHHGGPRRG